MYKFTNSKIPQFFSYKSSINILSKLLKSKNQKKTKKIYISRQNTNYRNLINEEDLISFLKLNDFEIVDTSNMEIVEQIDLFSSSEIVISPTSSALTNIIFCSRGTKIIEICPNYQFDYEQPLKQRYAFICKQLGLDYFSIYADQVEIKNFDEKSVKFVSKKVLNESNYYKDLIIKKDKFIKHFEKFNS